jgi:ribosomal protein S24E
MEIKITHKEEKPLLHREECTAEITDSKTPSNAELKKVIAEKMNKDESLILIKKIEQKFGKQETIAKFYVYKTVESIGKFERFRKPKKQAGAA